MATAREWSSVVYRNEDGDAMIVADHLGFPNGIGTSYDDQLLYVSSSHAYVLIYKRLPDGKLILRDRIDVPILSDNLRVNPVDGSFLVSGKLRSCCVCVITC
jgi:sugar lactone lactonase YvrE